MRLSRISELLSLATAVFIGACTPQKPAAAPPVSPAGEPAGARAPSSDTAPQRSVSSVSTTVAVPGNCLTATERQALLSDYRHSADPGVRFRAHVLLLLDAGHPWAPVGAVRFRPGAGRRRRPRRLSRTVASTG